jgi:hypothetical protein
VLTVAAAVFVIAIAGFVWTTYRRFKAQQVENVQREAARARRRAGPRLSAPKSGADEVAPAPEIDDERQRRAS